jgi:2-polyprenyl-3-methyl-5-hydroxy-6-metoxy-1,4-benzoquinol methylase
MKKNSVENYGWSTAAAPHSFDYLASAVEEELDRLGSKRVLDLGAGNGTLCGRLSTRGIKVVGVEYDAQGVDIARRSYPAVRFHQHSVEDDPALLLQHEQPFDTVVSTEVIEHLYSPHCLPQFARCVLKDDGCLIVTTPYHGYLKNLALSLMGHWDQHHTVLWRGGHIKFFSRTTLTQLLEENGFEVVRFAGVGRVVWLWKSMIITARKRP